MMLKGQHYAVDISLSSSTLGGNALQWLTMATGVMDPITDWHCMNDVKEVYWNNNNNEILIKLEALIYTRARYAVQKERKKAFRLGQ